MTLAEGSATEAMADMKRISLVVAALSGMALVGCGMSSMSSYEDSPGGARNAGSSSGGGSSSPSESGGGGTSTVAPGTGSSSGTADPAAPGTPGKPTTNLPQSGQLTAGVWDDNLNFDFYKKYLTLSGDPAAQGLPSFSLAEREQVRSQLTLRAAKSELDLTFLLDTTGSMGDELDYLQSEIDGIAQTIAAKHPQITPRFNLVVYRDEGDQYVAKGFSWGSAADLKKALDQQSVGGGGDYPEAVAQGLATTVALDWRAGANIARLAFWVADAPHHIGEESAVRDAIVKAGQKDIHLYPVAASGTDDRAEFTMRTAAQMTGGRYVFLTNDSGIGNDHAEPHIPCYEVTRFDGALVRMVESELAGQRVAPAATEVLRSIGNPANGQCAISSGNVSIY